MFGWTVDTANPTKPQLVTEYNCEPRSDCLLLLTRL